MKGVARGVVVYPRFTDSEQAAPSSTPHSVQREKDCSCLSKHTKRRVASKVPPPEAPAEVCRPAGTKGAG